MKVLVLGATGFIGFPAAQALVRNGHEVYGQTRNAEKTKLLASEEIIPVVADPTKKEEWVSVAEKVDVVIDCIGGMDIKTISQYVFEVALEAAKKTRGTSAPRLTYIYCSGTWVHGDDRVNTASESAVPKNTTTLVSWRTAQEQRVTAASDAGLINGIVVRPSLLYGRSGSIIAMLFGAAVEAAKRGEKFEWAGRKGGRWPVIHVDDLADLFVRIAEAGPTCKGTIIDASNSYTESVDDVLENVARVAGAPGWAYREPTNPFEEAIAVTSRLRPSLGRSLLGWVPKKAGLVDGMEIYFNSFKAFA
ncbi:NAD-binding protein [Fomitiporia mediterranea MF3/22]|uniref:NAD-binding protein n=1 Tax=Fomitiporia mediterranea (strain MF3/22) TaxID=694068 RepID=UPI0004407ECA|nr:NAD-binding protein [Fomitiporia mediterranea MF3/22]EJD05188.1 NAD-binding protein [Fomitiporia mediterranea MF3/22]